MGGVGKTTLAKELFNRKSLNYRRTSFLFDVREKYVTSQLPSLQGKLFKDLFDRDISFTSTEEGKAYLKDRLQRSPLLNFLVVVDDVDHVEQLIALAVMGILKNSANSLVIVTTRDAGVLISAGITVGYNLKGMDRSYGRELFCWHAFRQAHPCSGYEALVENFVDVCGGLPLSLQVLGRHVHGRDQRYWSSELNKVSKTLPRDIKKRLLISFEALDDDEQQVFMDIACFFLGKLKSIAEKVWEQSGWDAGHALEMLKEKCLVEEIAIRDPNEGNSIGLRMHDHLRDMGREMALKLSPPHRLWRPRDLKYLELGGLKHIFTRTNSRCFYSFFDKSMQSRVTFFVGHSDNCLETPGSLIWLPLERNSKEELSIPLRKLHYLKIHLATRSFLWENGMEVSCSPILFPVEDLTQKYLDSQAPFQLKELQISQTSLKVFPEFFGISDNLENVFLDARGLPIQGLSLLESLKMNISSLCLRFSTLIGEKACTRRGERKLSEYPLAILNFKFSEEMHWDSKNAPMSGLEKLEISSEESISKILISGTYYPSLESIELYRMENLLDVDLTGVRTLHSLYILDCQKLKRLATTSDPPNISWNSTSTDSVPISHCNNVSEESSFRMLAQLNISECPELEELRLGHLSYLKKVTVGYCYKLKYLYFSDMKCLENIEINRDPRNLNCKLVEFCCEELVEISILDCPKLEALPRFEVLNSLERIVIDGCGKMEALNISHCPNLKSVSGNFEIRELHITNCPLLEELPYLSRMSCLERIMICQCEKIQYVAEICKE